jgi:hypothetical protein
MKMGMNVNVIVGVRVVNNPTMKIAIVGRIKFNIKPHLRGVFYLCDDV